MTEQRDYSVSGDLYTSRDLARMGLPTQRGWNLACLTTVTYYKVFDFKESLKHLVELHLG